MRRRVWEVTYDLRMRKKEVGKSTVVEKIRTMEVWKTRDIGNLGYLPSPHIISEWATLKNADRPRPKTLLLPLSLRPTFCLEMRIYWVKLPSHTMAKKLSSILEPTWVSCIYPTRASLPPPPNKLPTPLTPT